MRRLVSPPPTDAADALEKVAARARWKRWKDRQDRGAIVVGVEIDHLLVGRMIDHGLIAERDATSKTRLARALALYLANALGDAGPDWREDGGQ